MFLATSLGHLSRSKYPQNLWKCEARQAWVGISFARGGPIRLISPKCGAWSLIVTRHSNEISPQLPGLASWCDSFMAEMAMPKQDDDKLFFSTEPRRLLPIDQIQHDNHGAVTTSRRLCRFCCPICAIAPFEELATERRICGSCGVLECARIVLLVMRICCDGESNHFTQGSATTVPCLSCLARVI